MNKKDWFVITDFDTFINATRALVFNNFGNSENDSLKEIALEVSSQDEEELEKILSFSESSVIAKEILRKQTNKITNKSRYLISDQTYMELINALNNRMVGNILHGLVNKGLVETSFDEEANDFVFWIKDDKKELPETD